MTRQRRALMAAGALLAVGAGGYLLRRRFGEQAQVTPAGGSPVTPREGYSEDSDSSELSPASSC
jgi:hypothetical protein